MMDQHKRYYENSLRNFRMSLDMDMSNDMFLVHYIKVSKKNLKKIEVIIVI